MVDGSARGDREEGDGAAGPHEGHEVARRAHVPRSDRTAIMMQRKRRRRLLPVMRYLCESTIIVLSDLFFHIEDKTKFAKRVRH